MGAPVGLKVRGPEGKPTEWLGEVIGEKLTGSCAGWWVVRWDETVDGRPVFQDYTVPGCVLVHPPDHLLGRDGGPL